MPHHLDEEILELYVVGVPVTELPRVIGHLGGCQLCQARATHELDIAMDMLLTVEPAEVQSSEEWNSAVSRTRH